MSPSNPSIFLLEEQINQRDYTKSDFKYHNLKVSLHALWAEIHATSNNTRPHDREIVQKIQACLENLEKSAMESEQRKYRQYYL